MRAVVTDTGQELATNIAVADSLLSRMKGLLGKVDLAHGEGLWIRPCKGIHTFGMRFAIDAVFLDGNMKVVAVVRNIRPNRMTPIYFQASSVIELAASVALPGVININDTVEIA